MREVWKSGVSGVVSSPFLTVQRMQYYPSGLPWADCMGADYQNRKYNGKEFIEMHGLDEYDSEARWYYPAIMRTTTIDPLAEEYYSISPYAWCGNNPVRYIDPEGMWYDDYTIDRDGYIKRVRETSDKYDMLYTKKDYDSGKTDNGLKLDKEKEDSRTILADLEEKSITINQTNRVTTLKTFKYVADNSNVEWAFSRYLLNKSAKYAIWTSHNKHSVDAASQVGINNETAHIHSHPSILNDYKKEMESMGANWSDTHGGYFWKTPTAVIGKGIPDWQRVYQSKGNTMEAVYFPQSQNLYRLRKGEWDVPLLIRNAGRAKALIFW